jgi:hypothetical protein
MIADTEPGLLPANVFGIEEALQIWLKRLSVGLFLFCDVTFFDAAHKSFNPCATHGAILCMGLHISALPLP